MPYTGGGPGELYLQEDKALAKKLLAYEKVLYPDYATFAPGALFETGGNLRMPLFVKPLRMDASLGIDANSLVRSTQELMERVGLKAQCSGARRPEATRARPPRTKRTMEVRSTARAMASRTRRFARRGSRRLSARYAKVLPGLSRTSSEATRPSRCGRWASATSACT